MLYICNEEAVWLDPIAALMIDKRWSDRQWSKVVTGVVKARRNQQQGQCKVGAGSRQRRYQQARSERQAANDQKRRSTVQVVHGKTNWEIRSEM